MSRSYLTHYSVRNALNEGWQNAQNEWMEFIYDKVDYPKPDEEFGTCYYQVLEMATRNTDAFLFVPPEMKTGDQDQDSDWEQVEYWALTWDQNVKNILRVDPKAAPGEGKELIWTADAVVAATKSIPTGPGKAKMFCKSWPASFMKDGVPSQWPFSASCA